MPLTEFHGLPTHVLLVHFVVVLVPLSALVLVVSAVWPQAARRFGCALPLLVLLTLAFVPFTTHAGAWLKARVPDTAQIDRHAELGDGMLPWVAAMAAMSLAVWWVTHRESTAARSAGAAGTRAQAQARAAGAGGVPHPRRTLRSLRRPGLVRTVTAVLAVAAAVGAVVHVYRVGDSGSTAVWHGVV